jgi:hypothetical protein
MNLVVLAVALFVAMVVCQEIGYRLGRMRGRTISNAFEGFDAIEGAVFGLFALLLSLSFFGAATRLDARRQLIVSEANAIATAYMRLDLLPGAEQPEARHLFREYVDERVRISEMSNEAAALSATHNEARLQQAIWSHAIGATEKNVPGAALLIPAVNQMFEIAAAKAIAVQTHLPGLVFDFLVFTALVSGVVAGFGMARGQRNWLSVIAFASVVAATLYVMIDMEYPRAGLIRIGAADLALTNLRDSIH